MPDDAHIGALAGSWVTQSIEEKSTSPGIDSLSVPGSGCPVNAARASSQDKYFQPEGRKTSYTKDARLSSPDFSKAKSRAPGSNLQPEITPAVEDIQETEIPPLVNVGTGPVHSMRQGWIRFKEQHGEIDFKAYVELVCPSKAGSWDNYIAFLILLSSPISFAQYQRTG